MEAVTAADRLRGVCFLLAVPTAVFGIAQSALLCGVLALAAIGVRPNGHQAVDVSQRR